MEIIGKSETNRPEPVCLTDEAGCGIGHTVFLLPVAYYKLNPIKLA